MAARTTLLVAGLALALAVAPAAAQTEDRQLYEKYCAQCHGSQGDGVGHATARVKPAPRDFRPGKYKFRTTPSGMLPTDDDLRRVIRKGLPYTSMPAWPDFTDAEVQELIDYIKAFSDAFENPDKRADPIDIPQPLPSSEESIARGVVVYEEQGCAACHGKLGRGDGLSAPTMKDDWGDHIRPADMTQRWTFRGGATAQDMFRTFSTGLNGTPMPSYYDSLEVEDRWHLVNYMRSLGDGDEPNYATLLIVNPVEDELDLADPALFDKAPTARFPLVGQVVEPGRNFYPSSTSIEVQAVYNMKEIAFRLRWNDMRAETSGSNAPDLEVPLWDDELAAISPPAADAADEDDLWGEAVDDDPWGEEAEEDFWGEEGDTGAAASSPDTEFSDAVAIQLPSKLPEGIRKPYFLFGDLQNSVDLWFLDLARGRPSQYVGRGSGSITPSDTDDFEVTTSYEDGRWTAVFKRSLKSGSGVAFEQGRFVPLAFSVWDGFNRERGNRRALSQWFHLYVEPFERVSPVGPMIKAAAATLGIELLLIVWIRRKYRSKQTEGSSSGGVLPEGGLARPSD